MWTSYLVHYPVNLKCYLKLKVHGYPISHSPCSPTSTDHVQVTKLVSHYQIYDEASTKTTLLTWTVVLQFTVIVSACLSGILHIVLIVECENDTWCFNTHIGFVLTRIFTMLVFRSLSHHTPIGNRCLIYKKKSDGITPITIFRPIAVFCGTDSILQNIPRIQSKCEEYFA